jgi:hypothetical protein
MWRNFKTGLFELHVFAERAYFLQVSYLPQLQDVGGVRCIPFMQVILMLSTDLDGSDDRDKASLDNLLTALIAQLGMLVRPFTDYN